MAAGKIRAITGDARVDRLNRDPQDLAITADVSTRGAERVHDLLRQTLQAGGAGSGSATLASDAGDPMAVG